MSQLAHPVAPPTDPWVTRWRFGPRLRDVVAVLLSLSFAVAWFHSVVVGPVRAQPGGQVEVPPTYPKPGWVEHDPAALVDSVGPMVARAPSFLPASASCSARAFSADGSMDVPAESRLPTLHPRWASTEDTLSILVSFIDMYTYDDAFNAADYTARKGFRARSNAIASNDVQPHSGRRSRVTYRAWRGRFRLCVIRLRS